MSNKTEIRGFERNGLFFRHMLDLSDDSISLIDEEDVSLVVYTAKSEVLLRGQDKLGSFRINAKGYWEFVNVDDEVYESTYHQNDVEGLLDFEVEISKLLLVYFDMEKTNKTKEDLVNDKTIPFYQEIKRMPVNQVKELAEVMVSASLALELNTDYKRIFTKAKNKRKAGALRRIYEFFERLDRGRVEILSKALSELGSLNEAV